MEVSGQIENSAALFPGKEHPLPIEYVAQRWNKSHFNLHNIKLNRLVGYFVIKL
jgi:hypothetical protein